MFANQNGTATFARFIVTPLNIISSHIGAKITEYRNRTTVTPYSKPAASNNSSYCSNHSGTITPVMFVIYALRN